MKRPQRVTAHPAARTASFSPHVERTQLSIELVLGSGAAHGLAHIGFLRGLTAQPGVKIVAVHGTSIGALVGAAWSAGSLDDLERLVSTRTLLRGLRYADVSVTGRSLIRGRRVEAALRRLFGTTRMEQLPVPVTAATVDLDDWQLHRVATGPVAQAIRASIGIPGIFAPYSIGGRRLVDGTLVSTLPIPHQQHPEADMTVAVSVLGRPDRTDTTRRSTTHVRRFLPHTLMTTFDIMQNSIQEATISENPDTHIIDIPVADSHSLAFHRSSEIIARGHAAAHTFLQQHLSPVRPIPTVRHLIDTVTD